MIILNRRKDRERLDTNPAEFFKTFKDFKGDLEQTLNQLQELMNSNADVIDAKSKTRITDIKKGDKFYGSITTTIKDPNTNKKVRTEIMDTFEMVDPGTNGGSVSVKDSNGNIFKTSRRGIKLRSKTIDKELLEAKKKLEEEIKRKEEEKRILEEKGVDFSKADTPTRLRRTIEAGIKNIWLCGPAGSGNKRY